MSRSSIDLDTREKLHVELQDKSRKSFKVEMKRNSFSVAFLLIALVGYSVVAQEQSFSEVKEITPEEVHLLKEGTWLINLY